jgi:hypothetical protein
MPRRGNLFEVVQSTETKIVRVPRHRGILAYWGLAISEHYHWSTLKWLREQVAVDHSESPESFAHHLTEELIREIDRMKFVDPLAGGIGIHFAAYESVGDKYQIPELFVISNFENTNYNSLYAAGNLCTRQTFNVVKAKETGQEVDPLPEHREPDFRQHVQDYLYKSNNMLLYNNGDPLLFNPIALGVFESIQILRQRGALHAPNDIETYRRVARLIIQTVCDVQRKLVPAERSQRNTNAPMLVISKRRIGGKPHVLAVTPRGEFYPASGDLL